MCGYKNKQRKWVANVSYQTFLFSLMSQSLRHWIPCHPGQLSSITTSAKINMSINRYPEIGDDSVTLTDNDAGWSLSISMIFDLDAVAVDDDIISVVSFLFSRPQ